MVYACKSVGCYSWLSCICAKVQKLGYGAIINVASAASYTAAPEMSVYNVTKAGVLALSETLSAELRKFNIKVNVLCPTLVPTNIIKMVVFRALFQACRPCTHELCHDDQRCSCNFNIESIRSWAALHHATDRRQIILAYEKDISNAICKVPWAFVSVI